MRIERTVIEGDNRRATWGLLAGVGATFLAIVCATLLAYHANNAGAAILLGGSVATMIGSLITAQRKKGHELDAKKASVQNGGKDQHLATKPQPRA